MKNRFYTKVFLPDEERLEEYNEMFSTNIINPFDHTPSLREILIYSKDFDIIYSDDGTNLGIAFTEKDLPEYVYMKASMSYPSNIGDSKKQKEFDFLTRRVCEEVMLSYIFPYNVTVMDENNRDVHIKVWYDYKNKEWNFKREND